jgi:hypothetical protein
MTSISYGRGRSAADRLLRSAARGAILIGVAAVIGIVLLQVVGNGPSGPTGAVSSNGNNGNKVTTTTSSGARSPQEVAVAVFNASGVSQAASTKSNDLRGLGYVIVKVGNAAAVQTGTTIACRVGYEAEAAQLQALPTFAGSTIATFPEPAPAETELANCIINVGK